MKQNKPNKSVNTLESPIQNQHNGNVAHNKGGFFPLILGLLVILLVIGGAYYLGTQKNNAASPPATQPTSNTQLVTSNTTQASISNWKTYNNQKLGLLIKYPQSLYLKEFEAAAAFTFEPYPTEEGVPEPQDLIKISQRGNQVPFDALFKANQGDDVPEAHGAVDVKVTKLRNLKFGNHDAVEYIRDGLTAPKSGLGRGPIGYEHHILIKKENEEFIELTNKSMDLEKAKLRDAVFNEMVSSLSFH